MRAIGVVAVAFCITATPAGAEVDKALLKPSFTASPKELLAAAKGAPPGDWPIGIIRQENQIRFDDQGRAISRWRIVFVVRSQAGADEWGTMAHAWQPFYQDKPVVRARVIEPGGKVTELDQALIHDAPAVETSPSVFSDRRRLEAPLPRLQIGAVVEQEIITADRVPLLAAGTVDSIQFGGSLPIASSLFQLSAPTTRKAKVIARNIPAKIRPRHDVAGGRETWTYDVSLLPQLPDWEPFVPGDVVQTPYVGISTAASWTAVARDYRKLLDRRISDGAFALPGHLPRTPTIESVRAIVSWLHQQVRYTGIEFGDASTIPWPPAETVKRGFGDCKDKATLLIAVLRDAGIRADLALLSTGPGIDLDRDLPGMGVFDHAIVRAQVGGRDVWIDATEDLVSVGDLPTRDQGRRALIIANDTRDLVMTPRAGAAETVLKQVRTFALAEAGAARVTEVSREAGPYGTSMRTWIRDTRADEVRKELGSYAEAEYRAKSLEGFVTTSPADLGTPFEISLVAIDANRAYTGRDRIDVYLFATDTLEKLPELLSTVDEKTTRRNDFELPRPHTFEIQNRLVLPPGYTPPSLAADRVRKLGTMTLTERQQLDGQTLVITYTLVTGKPRLNPAELRAVQLALAALDKEESHIVIEHSGWALVERGKPKQAIAEVQKLIALHPKEALHHTQLAFVLLNAGAGSAARSEAQAAVKLEPTSADAHVVLGWVLRHDTLGREYGFDHDRGGAIAALRRARKLDPKHVGAAADLATVLERDLRGIAYNEGADLKGAVEAWRAAHELDKTDEYALNLTRALIRAGDAGEAERVARTIPAGDLRDSLLVAAVALARGGKAAISEVSTLRTGLAQTTTLNTTAGLMTMMRRYDLARELFDHTGSFQRGTPQAKLIDGLVRQTTKPGSSKDPREVARNYFFLTMSSAASGHLFWDDVTHEELARANGNQVPPQQQAQLKQMGTGMLWDMASSSVVIDALEGRPKGPWRLSYTAFDQRAVLYLALDGERVKIIGEATRPAGIGRHALRLLTSRDEVGARALLDWFRLDVQGSKTIDNANNPFLRVWGPNARGDKDAVPLAAAVVASGTERVTSIPILAACATKIVDARKSCDLPLALAYFATARWKELEAHTTAWALRDTSTTARFAAQFRAYSLAQLGRFDEADKIVDLALASSPDDQLFMHSRVELAIARGQVDVAIERLVAMTKLGGPAAEAKNNLAWLRVAVGKDFPAALVVSREAVSDSKEATHHLNTLAAVLLELDDLGAARTEGWKAMAVGNRERPAPEDWYVIGRLYEKLGLRDEAIAAYKRLPPDTYNKFIPTSYALARARLDKLGVKKP